MATSLAAMEVEENGISGADFTGPRVHFSDQIEVDVIRHVSTRPKHKARRRAKPVKETETTEEVTAESMGVPKPIAMSKLRKLMDKDRHLSRSGKGRGQPKKGGAGGKGTWGKITEVFGEEDSRTNDVCDPNYDSEEEEDTYIVSPSSPQMSLATFEKQAGALFREYFENDDPEEVAYTLGQFNIKNIKHEIIRLLLVIVLEKKLFYCEQASQLISFLCGRVINSREIAAGFDAVLAQLNDLLLDSPNAAEILGNFIARSVADDCLPPAYIDNHFNIVDGAAYEALSRARLLLKMSHSHARLEHIWGAGGGQQPMPQLVDQIILLLKEYCSSGDKEEAVRCLQELAVPHFHHEVVYEAVILVLEDGSEPFASHMVDLLVHLAKIAVITQQQMQQGFLRVFGTMTELVLDAPFAYATLNRLVESCLKAGIISPQLVEQTPQRGRKRFVSEGDGGAIKPEY